MSYYTGARSVYQNSHRYGRTVSTPAGDVQVNFYLATEKQRSFIKDLTDARELAPEHREWVAGRLSDATLTKKVASQIIERLLALPKLAPVTETKEVLNTTNENGIEIVEGRYAVDFEGKLRFFKVDKPVEGKWKGYTFVNEQASDDLYPVRNRNRRDNIIRAIVEAGIEAAMVRYGHALGVCGKCGKTLTDEASRLAGIGPVCASKLG